MTASVLAQDPFAEMERDAERQRQLTLAAHSICQGSDVGEVRKLIEAGWDVNQSIDGRKPFHLAISRGFTEGVLLMISAGAKLDEPDDQGDTALSVAAADPVIGSSENAIHMVELLLDHGADVQAGNERAMQVASGHSLSMVKRLLKAGGKLTPESLEAAVDSNQHEVVDFLIQKGVDPQVRFEHGRTLLHCLPDEVGLKKLLALGLDVNARDEEGRTPLHHAASKGYGSGALALLNHGADVNALDTEKNTPLMFSAYNESENITDLLITRGADKNLRDKDGDTVLEWAWTLKSWNTVAFLLDKGMTFRNPQESLQEFVVEAASSSLLAKGGMKALTLLLPRVTGLAEVRPDGRPLLIWAVLMGQPEVMELFIRAGVPVDAVDRNGRTALMWAGMTGAKKMYQQLITAGARPELKDAGGKAATDWAKWWDDMNAARQPGTSDGSPLRIVGVQNKGDAFFNGIIHNRIGEVRALLEEDRELMKLRRGGLPPLHHAASMGRQEVMGLLIEKGAQLDEKASTGETPVMLAVSGGQVEEVIWMLDRTPAKLHAVLFAEAADHAVATKHNLVLGRLIQDGWRPKRGGPTIEAFGVALERQDTGLLRQLFEAGAVLETTIKNDACGTDLLENFLGDFSRSGKKEMIEVLFRHLDKPVKAKYPGAMAGFLIARASAGDVPGMEVCLQAGGVDVNCRVTPSYGGASKLAGLSDERFETPVSRAAASGKVEAVAYLLDRGARLDGAISPSSSPLHIAVKTGNQPMLELLLRRGASPDVKDESGKTVLQLAEEKGMTEMVEILQQSGGKVPHSKKR